MANVNVGANLGFKVGEQSTVNTILANGTGAVHGSFYLTKDTHRLYVGNSDGSLSPVNEGVTTVSAVASLPTPSGSADWIPLQGQFYYCTAENILCVASGEKWVQINPDTYIDATTANTTLSGATSNGITTATITNSVSDAGGRVKHTSSGNFKIKGSNNVQVTVDETSRTITLSSPDGATYSLTAATSTSDNTVDLVLTNKNNNQTEIVSIQGSAGGVVPQLQADGKTIKLVGGGLANSNATINLEEINNQVRLDLTDGVNHHYKYITPTFELINENGTKTTVTGTVSGTGAATDPYVLNANLNTYTKDAIDALLKEKIQNLDAMYFAGTIGNNGTYSSLAALKTALEDKDKIKAGATFKITEAIATNNTTLTITGWDSNGLQIGDLLIVTGTETADGYIDPAASDFEIVYVPSGDDTDIYFTPNFVTDNTLQFTKSGANGAVHKAIFASGKNITLTDNTVNGTNGGKNKTLTIAHETIATTNSEEEAVSQSAANSAPVYTAITGLELDNGHVKEIKTTKLNLWSNRLKTVSTTASDAATTQETNKGMTAIKVVTSYTDMANNKVTGNNKNDWRLSSETLNVTAAVAGSADGSAATMADVKIEMLWGSF